MDIPMRMDTSGFHPAKEVTLMEVHTGTSSFRKVAIMLDIREVAADEKHSNNPHC